MSRRLPLSVFACRDGGRAERDGTEGRERMPFCDHCYESDATICQRVADTTLTCSFRSTTAVVNERSADGLYDTTVRNRLPEPVRSLEAAHIDTIVGYTARRARGRVSIQSSLFRSTPGFVQPARACDTYLTTV